MSTLRTALDAARIIGMLLLLLLMLSLVHSHHTPIY